jgi:hypothetical protein
MMPVIYRCVVEACGLLRLVIGALVATSDIPEPRDRVLHLAYQLASRNCFFSVDGSI